MLRKSAVAIIFLLLVAGGCGHETKTSTSEVKQQNRTCVTKTIYVNIFICGSAEVAKVANCDVTMCYRNGSEISRTHCQRKSCVLLVGGRGSEPEPRQTGGGGGGGSGGFGAEKPRPRPPGGWSGGGN